MKTILISERNFISNFNATNNLEIQISFRRRRSEKIRQSLLKLKLIYKKQYLKTN